jgi:hypothetical protein
MDIFCNGLNCVDIEEHYQDEILNRLVILRNTEQNAYSDLRR